MQGGRIKGVILGNVSSHAYADGLVASDVALYVAPSLRGTDCYSDLATTFDNWCARIPNLLGSMLSLSQLNATSQVMDSVYTGLGYKLTGKDYIKMVNQNQ